MLLLLPWCQLRPENIVLGGVVPEDGEVLLLWFQLHPHCGGRGGAEDSRTASTQH